MSTNNDGSKYVYMALGFGFIVILCSLITEFNLLDFLYLVVVVQVFIRYKLICRKEKDQ